MTRSVFHGHEGVRQAWRESLSVWDEVAFEVTELTDLGDHVLCFASRRYSSTPAT